MTLDTLVIALLALWVLVWLVSACLAAREAGRHGYDSGLFFRYGLLAGPWAYTAAKAAPAYAVSIPLMLPPAAPAQLPAAIEPVVEPQETEPVEEPTVPVDEPPSFAPPLSEAEQEEIDAMIAAEAAELEAMLAMDDAVEPDVPAEEAPAEPHAEEPKDPSLDGWQTRDGRTGGVDLSELASMEAPTRVRRSRAGSSPLEDEESVDPPTVEDNEPKKRGGLFGRRKKKDERPEAPFETPAKPIEIPVEQPVELPPITDAVAPVEPLTGTCSACQQPSYPDWHGLCSRCGEVWLSSVGGKKKRVKA